MIDQQKRADKIIYFDRQTLLYELKWKTLSYAVYNDVSIHIHIPKHNNN